jgi:hypothetical protein
MVICIADQLIVCSRIARCSRRCYGCTGYVYYEHSPSGNIACRVPGGRCPRTRVIWSLRAPSESFISRAFGLRGLSHLILTWTVYLQSYTVTLCNVNGLRNTIAMYEVIMNPIACVVSVWIYDSRPSSDGEITSPESCVMLMSR